MSQAVAACGAWKSRSAADCGPRGACSLVFPDPCGRALLRVLLGEGTVYTCRCSPSGINLLAAASARSPVLVTSGAVPLAVWKIFLVRLSPRVFCFLLDSSAFVYVGSGRSLAAAVGRVVYEDGVICGGFGIGDSLLVAFLCADVRILCKLIWAVCAPAVRGGGNLISFDTAVGVWRIVLFLQGGAVFGCLVRFVVPIAGLLYQREESGWCFVPTCSGGSVPFRGDSSSGMLGFLVEASDSSVLGDVFPPGRSAFLRHVEVDVLLKTASKIYFPLPERRSASSLELRPPEAMKTGRSLQGLVCIFLFCQGSPCKIWVVTTNFSM
ncbi:unnamed protein product [Urochloa humidicola]